MRPSLYAVAGRPILHSLSPGIFTEMFRRHAIHAVYTRLSSVSANEALKTAIELGMQGINVTAPLKTAMFHLMDDTDEASRVIGAVNTVTIRDGTAYGSNTDRHGVIDPLLRRGITLPSAQVLVIGTGGAARAAIYGLSLHDAHVTITGRNDTVAREIARRTHIHHTPWNRRNTVVEQADIIISALSEPVIPVDPSLLRTEQILFDARYHNAPFARVAEQKGVRVISGEEWLISQAVRSCECFTGTAPDHAGLAELLSPATTPTGENIALIGFMGGGKTKTGRALHAHTGLPHIDTDRFIENRTGMSVSDIFAHRGEYAFREYENTAMLLFDAFNSHIFSCGGGALSDPHNRNILKRSAVTVWLYASAEITARRLSKSRHARPLLQAGNPDSIINELLYRRIPHYAAAADMVLPTDRSTPDKNAEVIHAEINSTR